MNVTGCSVAALDCDGYPDLARSTPVPCLMVAADVGLVGLDVALQKWRRKGPDALLVTQEGTFSPRWDASCQKRT